MDFMEIDIYQISYSCIGNIFRNLSTFTSAYKLNTSTLSTTLCGYERGENMQLSFVDDVSLRGTISYLHSTQRKR